jgi:IclR family pca regulon transcriptional regulator
MAYRTQIQQIGPVDDRYYLESVGRAIVLLDHLSRSHRPQKLADLVATLGWSKPMVYRLVRTLEAHGVVRSHRDGYVPGPLLITMGQGALDAINLSEVALPYLERLHDEFNETVNLSILDNDEIVIVHRVETQQILGLRLSVGSRLPAYCTSVGHVLLAGLPDEEITRRLADTTFDSVGPNTVKSMSELLDRLHAVAAQGYAVNDEELAKGHRAAAAPVRDHEDKVIAAINVSVPSARIVARDVRSRMVPALVRAAAAISSELGAAEL